MRIQFSGQAGGVVAGAALRRGGTGGFTLDADTPAPGSRAASGMRAGAAVSGLAGMLALQEVEDATSRPRRRAIAGGHAMLDLLEDIRLSLLAGRMATDKLERLALLAGEQADAESGLDDPGLAGVLGEIRLRALVELAKLGRAP